MRNSLASPSAGGRLAVFVTLVLLALVLTPPAFDDGSAAAQTGGALSDTRGVGAITAVHSGGRPTAGYSQATIDAYNRSVARDVAANPNRTCTYTDAETLETNLPYLTWGNWYIVRCQGNNQPAREYLRQHVIGGLAPEELIRDRAELRLRTEIPRSSPSNTAVVGIPTWFWMDRASEPRTATATTGSVTATVSARVRSLEINPGDGTDPITCAPDAPPYSASAAGRETPPQACTHVFNQATVFTNADTNAANNADTTPTFEVIWEVWWETDFVNAAGANPGGSLDDIVVTGPLDLEVVEIQAVGRSSATS